MVKFCENNGHKADNRTVMVAENGLHYALCKKCGNDFCEEEEEQRLQDEKIFELENDDTMQFAEAADFVQHYMPEFYRIKTR